MLPPFRIICTSWSCVKFRKTCTTANGDKRYRKYCLAKI